MRGDGAAVLEWVGVVLSLLLAVALPILSCRYVRKRNHLRELWQVSRPGAFMTLWIVGIIMLAASAFAFSLLASRYPSLWGTVLLHVSGLTALLIVVVSYVRFARQQLAQQVARNAANGDDQTPVG